MMATLLGEFSVTARRERVTGARHRVTSIAAEHLGDEHRAIGDIELLASELLTNAVVHTKTDQVSVLITMDEIRRILRVAVSDDGSGGAVLIPAEDPMSESGRGLLLLQVIAADWGVEADSVSRTVWFEVTF